MVNFRDGLEVVEPVHEAVEDVELWEVLQTAARKKTRTDAKVLVFFRARNVRRTCWTFSQSWDMSRVHRDFRGQIEQHSHDVMVYILLPPGHLKPLEIGEGRVGRLVLGAVLALQIPAFLARLLGRLLGYSGNMVIPVTW